jgi:pyruvate,orthophosphate dikinase
LNAGPGAATGRVVFNAPMRAWKKRATGHSNRIETSPEDIKGMNMAEGILTACGNDFAYGARRPSMGKVCVAGCSALEID